MNESVDDETYEKTQCRLCMKLSNASLDICGADQLVDGVRNIIHRLFSFWVTTEDKIRSICPKCIETIKDFDMFRKTVLDNQIKSMPENEVADSVKLEDTDFDILYTDNNVNDDKNKSYSTELIKNGKFIVKRRALEEMASTFYDIQCDICTELQKFNKLSDMLIHYTFVHNASGYVTCCNTRLYRRDLIYMHMARHIQPSAFECPICKKKLTRLHALKPHLETHLPEIERSYKCDQCDRSYINSSGLNYHKSTTHVPKELRTHYDCELCNKTFNSSSAYYSHVSTTHETPKYLCSECGRNFQIKRNYLEHLQTHDDKGQNRVQCQYCGFVCKNKGSFKYHMKLHNTERFNCAICQYTTHRKTFLNQHMKVKHSDDKPYSCDICGKRFKLKSSLKNHMPLHTGERKFSCPHCPKKFAASSNYYSHLNKMHYDVHKARLNTKQCGLIMAVDQCVNNDASIENCLNENMAREKIKQLQFKCRKKSI